MEIKLIICTTTKFLVGDANPTSKNGMSWYSKEELQYFKQCTVGHTVVFGENTSKLVPLDLMKKDRNIEILSPNNNWESIINKYKDTEETIFICGGYTVYKWFLNECIKNDFKYPFDLSSIYLSILNSHVSVIPPNKPLYLDEIREILKNFSTHKEVKYNDFIAYVYEK